MANCIQREYALSDLINVRLLYVPPSLSSSKMRRLSKTSQPVPPNLKHTSKSVSSSSASISKVFPKNTLNSANMFTQYTLDLANFNFVMFAIIIVDS